MVLTEVADVGTNPQARFWEISNIECFDVSLDGFQIGRYTDEQNSIGDILDLSGLYDDEAGFIKNIN